MDDGLRQREHPHLDRDTQGWDPRGGRHDHPHPVPARNQAGQVIGVLDVVEDQQPLRQAAIAQPGHQPPRRFLRRDVVGRQLGGPRDPREFLDRLLSGRGVHPADEHPVTGLAPLSERRRQLGLPDAPHPLQRTHRREPARRQGILQSTHLVAVDEVGRQLRPPSGHDLLRTPPQLGPQPGQHPLHLRGRRPLRHRVGDDPQRRFTGRGVQLRGAGELVDQSVHRPDQDVQVAHGAGVEACERHSPFTGQGVREGVRAENRGGQQPPPRSKRQQLRDPGLDGLPIEIGQPAELPALAGDPGNRGCREPLQRFAARVQLRQPDRDPDRRHRHPKQRQHPVHQRLNWLHLLQTHDSSGTLHRST